MKPKELFILMIMSAVLFTACSALESPVSESSIPEKQTIQENANLISEDEAKQLLLDFVNSNVSVRNNVAGSEKRVDVEVTESKIKEVSLDVQNEHGELLSEKVPYYELIIRKGDQTGYSIVVGDKRIQHVLASVDQGALSDTLYNIPLREYFRSIPAFIQKDLSDYYLKKDAPLPVTTRVQSITFVSCTPTLTWSQAYPYNAQCPISNCPPSTPVGAAAFNGRYATGCAPLAMAQILAHHRLPANLNWTSILASPTISSTAPSTIINPVAQLLKNLGDQVHVQYSCSGTTSSSSYIYSTFNAYGLYTSPNSLQSFSMFEIKYSLDNNRPVFMRGSHSPMQGHAWVCDGYKIHYYDTTEYYEYLRMNWGWGGLSNGYYYISMPLSFNTFHNGLTYIFSGIEIIANLHK